MSSGESTWLDRDNLGNLLGFLATCCFTFQYVPQIWLNFSRKSVKGFSSTGIMIKVIGAGFFSINSYFNHEAPVVILYGCLGVLQHSIFMLQFSIYPDGTGPAHYHFLLWLFFPFLPLFLGITFPATIAWTNFIKPISQFLSHLPQLRMCYNLKTTTGIALSTQHLSLAGGISGVAMCYLVPPKAVTTYMVYVNAIWQALSLYWMTVYYDGWRLGHSIKNHGY